jgi:hypothetical protein
VLEEVVVEYPQERVEPVALEVAVLAVAIRVLVPMGTLIQVVVGAAKEVELVEFLQALEVQA